MNWWGMMACGERGKGRHCVMCGAGARETDWLSWWGMRVYGKGGKGRLCVLCSAGTEERDQLNR
jgi:hypothetical protein